jgi:hypothetical protein
MPNVNSIGRGDKMKKRWGFFLTVAVGVLALSFSTAFAKIPKSVRAKSNVIYAEKALKNASYDDAIKHLNEAKALLNKTTSKIQYLLVKSYFGKRDFKKAQEEIDTYFSITPEPKNGDDQYNEMVVLVSEIAAGGPSENDTGRKPAASAPVSKSDNAALAAARKNGIPSPPVKLVVGKKWLMKGKENNAGNVFETTTTHSIVQQKGNEFIESWVFDEFKQNGQNMPAMKTQEHYLAHKLDGTDTRVPLKAIINRETSGSLWPVGRIKIGDTWDFREQYAFSSEPTKKSVKTIKFKALGFERLKDRNCLVMEKTTLTHFPYGNEATTTAKVYYDYQNGVTVRSELTGTSNRTSTTELVEVHFP